MVSLGTVRSSTWEGSLHGVIDGILHLVTLLDTGENGGGEEEDGEVLELHLDGVVGVG
jgi:hypothetical protein